METNMKNKKKSDIDNDKTTKPSTSQSTSQCVDILKIASSILKGYDLCDNCFGRQFAKLGTGLTNRQRGHALKVSLSMQNNTPLPDITTLPEDCEICNGFFDDENLSMWADRAIEATSGYEYNTFLAGTTISGIIAENEEMVWEEFDPVFAEQTKTEINREVGKCIMDKTELDVNFKAPDILFNFDIANDDLTVYSNSIYILGRYRKLVRGIPQTRWPHRDCHGSGCEGCNFTGKQYPESVEELAIAPLVDMAQSDDAVMHGAGREDIDALMLGTGRPFVIEAKQPRVRTIDLTTLKNRINEEAEGKIEVTELTLTERKTVEHIKGMHVDKTYIARVEFESGVTEETLLSAAKQLSGAVLSQRTPERVAHRRADLVRERRCHEMTVESWDGANKKAILKFNCEGGTYIKELVSGDDGRTVPSLAGILGVGAKVYELDVMGIDD